MAVTVLLSVCIVTYERRAFLRRCLEALDSAVSADVEFVVVDASAVAAAELVARIRPSAVYVHDPSVAGWMTRARNVALRHARGDVISFLDDDVVVSPRWQTAVLEAFADPSVDAVAGRTRNGQPGEEMYELPVGRLLPDGSLTEGFASLTPGLVDVDHGIGANMSFRRAMLARLGGFRDDYPGTAMREDTDIYLRIRRLGGRAVFAPGAVVDHLPAPHVKGKRFDTRYKLYALRNHMVLLARDGGIGSKSLRRWIGRVYTAVGEAPSALRRVRRWGVTSIGIAWGAAAMLRQARWSPTPPERTDATGRELRAALSRPERRGGDAVSESFGRRAGRHLAWRARRASTVATDRIRRGDRVVVMTPPAGMRFGNWLYLWLDAHRRTAAGEPTMIREAPGMAPWFDEFPRLRALTLAPSELRFHDRREWPEQSWNQRFGIDFNRGSLDAFILSTLVSDLRSDQGDTLVVNVRRGDYYSNPDHRARYGWDVPGYIADALGRAAPAENALIVSDDALWCRANLDALLRAVVPDVVYADPDPIANFRAIAGARRLIGTNSTFSYWGGYIAGARFGVAEVIMPRFHARLDTGSDAYQLDPRWTVIDGHF